ncbi:hypothetical protein GQ53DRAFT_841327 [Thozetella sp. PMI_491]|nr:hypothetical protein GQ53DRAFT_841327 [Thozetella sp. PMI_491]
MPIWNRITTSRRPLLEARVSATFPSRAPAYHGDPHRPFHRLISSTRPSVAIAAQRPPACQSRAAATLPRLLFPREGARSSRPLRRQPIITIAAAAVTSAAAYPPTAAHPGPLSSRARQHQQLHHHLPQLKEPATRPACIGCSPGTIPTRSPHSHPVLPQSLRFFHSSASKSGSSLQQSPTPFQPGPAPAASTSECPVNSQSPGHAQAHAGPIPQHDSMKMDVGSGEAPAGTPPQEPAAATAAEPTVAAPPAPRATVEGAAEADSDRPQGAATGAVGVGGSSQDAGGVDDAAAQGQQASATLLPLPAPGDGEGDDATATTTVEVNGKAVILDKLGPMVVGRDGTLSRIANWGEMAEIERQNALRILGKRNKLRLGALRAAAEAEKGK